MAGGPEILVPLASTGPLTGDAESPMWKGHDEAISSQVPILQWPSADPGQAPESFPDAQV